jgi:hypothetical protein
MLSFKSAADLQQLPSNHPAYNIIADLVQRLIIDWPLSHRAYDPEDDGCIFLVQEGDADRVLSDLWPGTHATLATLPWEGIRPLEQGHYQAILLTTNESGYVFVIPDAEWLGPELRQAIEDNLDSPWEG